MEKYLTMSEFMKCCKIGRSVAYALVKTPGFPSARIGKRILISESGLREWMNNGGTEQKGA